MHITHAKLDCGPVGSTCEPQIQVLAMFSGFEEEDVVAGMEISECVEGVIVIVGGLGVEFGVFVCVRQKRAEVCEKMSMPSPISCVQCEQEFAYLYETPLDVSISTLFRSSTGRSSSLDVGLGGTSSSSDVSLEEESASRVWLLSSLENIAPPSESE
jgi:hypothetical protein